MSTTDTYSRHLGRLSENYEEFREDSDFLKARKETAVLRTYLLKFLEGLEQRSRESYELFVADVYDSVKSRMMIDMGTEESQAEQWASWLVSSVPLAFQARMGGLTHVGVKELKAISQACKDIASMVKLQKELETETVLTVDVNMADILYVFRYGVLPLLPMELRRLVIHNMASTLEERFSGVDLEAEFSEDPVFAEYEFYDEEFDEEGEEECSPDTALMTLPVLPDLPDSDETI